MGKEKETLEGKLEGCITIASNMLQKGMDIILIMEVTYLFSNTETSKNLS